MRDVMLRRLRGELAALWSRARALEGGQVNASTTQAHTTSWVDLAGMSVTRSLEPGNLQVVCSIQFRCTAWTQANLADFQPLLDGNQVDYKRVRIVADNQVGPAQALLYCGAAGEGPHTWKVRIMKSDGNNTIESTELSRMIWLHFA